jgi:cytochrome c oxidase assembly protein subunit 19
MVFVLKLLSSGECKQFMTRYLDCLKKNSSASSECRHLNRDYLDCRMQKCVIRVQLARYALTHGRSGLMEKDEWKNLGLANLKDDDSGSKT